MCKICERLLYIPTELNCSVTSSNTITSLNMSYTFNNDKFWLNLYMSDSDEFDEYLADENRVEIFYCPFCGEELKSLIKETYKRGGKWQE